MRGKRDLYIGVTLLILLQSSLFIWSSYDSITGRQSYLQTVYSEAQIQKYASISMSGNMSDGIAFGTISALPATNVNATKNYNSTKNESWYNETLYWITVAGDSNTNVDICVRATNFTTFGDADEIGLGNYSWADNLTNNVDWPGLSEAAAMSNDYVMGTADVAPNGNNTYRFWLSVPAAQPAGTYNNTVYFKAVEHGIGCGI